MKILFLILFVSLIVIGLEQNVSAEMTGMSLTAEASEGSEMIKVRGQTAEQVTDVTLSVISPDGFNRIATDQVTPDANGNFATEFKTSPLWKQNGFYTITAMQNVQKNSLYTMSVEVEVINGKASETLVTESNIETGLYVPKTNETPKGQLILFADAIDGSTTIELIGFTDRTNLDIMLKVIAPNGDVVSSSQITSDLDGKFTFDITTGGPLWTQDGIYTITAQQGESSEYKDSENVEIVDGMVWGDLNSTPLMDPPPMDPVLPPSESQKIPDWVKNTMKWFVEGKISEDEMINALEYLIREGIIRV